MAAGANIKSYELLCNDYDIVEFLDRVTPKMHEECWIWEGAKVLEGYGFIKRKKNGKVDCLPCRKIQNVKSNAKAGVK